MTGALLRRILLLISFCGVAAEGAEAVPRDWEGLLGLEQGVWASSTAGRGGAMAPVVWGYSREYGLGDYLGGVQGLHQVLAAVTLADHRGKGTRGTCNYIAATRSASRWAPGQ